MGSTAKEMGAVSCLMVGLFLGVNAMVNEERNGWLMWAILFLVAALALWLWMMREQRSAEEEADNALKAAEESLKKIEAKTAPEKPAPSSPKPEVQTNPEPKAETKPIPAPAPIEAAKVELAPSPEEAPKPVETPKVEVPAAAPIASSEPDDLTRIEGVGPKYAEILVAAGIDSFAKLAALSEDAIVEIVRQGGGRKSASIGTWAEQAKLAAAGDWDGLAKLQSELSGGRK
jgi:small subunit ribosomal protein S2